MWFVPALFLLWPIVEIATLISVGRSIGILPTIGAIILTSALGVVLLRFEGLRVLRNVMATMQQGRRPDLVIAHAGLVALGGVLLVIPGFVSDVMGILLFLKPVRAGVIAFTAWMTGPYVEIRTTFHDGRPDGRGFRGPGVVDLDPSDWTERRDEPASGRDEPRRIGRGPDAET